MIEVKSLTKYYGDLPAVDNASFTVEKGEILGFLGPNGAGKTTTMRMLAAYMPATSGTATVAGYDIHTHPHQVRRQIGYMPEHPPLYEDLTVNAYLDFVARIKGMSAAERDEGIPAVLEKCGLGDVSERIIKHLSKGYKQRAGLAQALIHNPPVLILDEPTIGLDPVEIIEIRSLISNLRGSHTVVLSSHILPEVTQICDRIVIIRAGKIVADDTPENLARSMNEPGRIFLRLADAAGAREAIEKLDPVLSAEPVKGEENGLCIRSKPDADATAPLLDLAHQRGWGVREIRQDRVTLEEIYIRLTSE